MKKTLTALGLAVLAAILIAACGNAAPTNVGPAMEDSTTAEATSEFSIETASEAAESEPASQAGEAAFSPEGETAGRDTATTTARPTTKTTAPPAAATQATTRSTAPTMQSTTATTRGTTITTATTAPKPQTQPPKPVYTEADCAEIIAAVRAYAESKTKVKFVWDTSLTYEYAQSGRAGFHDVPNLTRFGKDSVLADLKHHCDLTEEAVSGGNGGAPSGEIHYNVCWFVDRQNAWGFGNGDTLFVLVYG